MTLVATFLLAQVAGRFASRLRIPGLGIIIPMFLVAAVSVTLVEVVVEPQVRTVMLVVIGSAIGAQISRDSLRALRSQLLGATIAATTLVLVGIGAGLVLRALGIAPHGDMLATSAGALSAVLAASAEQDYDTPVIAVFHIVRLTLVLASIPLLVRLMQRATGRRAADRRTDALEPAGPGPLSHGPLEPIGESTVRLPPTGRREALAAMLRFLVPVAAGSAASLLAVLLEVPLPIILVAFLGGSGAAIVAPRFAGLPKSLSGFLQYSLAWYVGSLVTEEIVAALGGILVAAVLSAVLLIIGGIGVAMLLRATGTGPAGDVLATSPGALEILTLIAREHGADPIEIGAYHTMRLIIVMLTLPLLLLITR